MKKIKVEANDKVIAFDFKMNILEINVLFKICKELSLSDIYIDIIGIDTRKVNFERNFIDKSNMIIVSPITKQKWDSFSIKAAINDIAGIVEILSAYDFDELNVWDVYTDWEKYLKDKKVYKRIKNQSVTGAKFYLNYNLIEGNKVELYCDPNYNAEKIYSKLVDIINANTESR